MRRIETTQDAMRCALIYVPVEATLYSNLVVRDLFVMVSSKGTWTSSPMQTATKGTEVFMEMNEIWDVSRNRLCYILFY